jgi:hypothetical protein
MNNREYKYHFQLLSQLDLNKDRSSGRNNLRQNTYRSKIKTTNKFILSADLSYKKKAMHNEKNYF